MGTARVGTSGWRYPHWRRRFYPSGLLASDELAYLAQRLDTVEVNGTFYRLQRPEVFDAWRGAVPPGFLFAVKGSRFLTHLRRLHEPEGPLANFFAQGVLRLGARLGPILWQLPPQLVFGPELAERTRRFLALLPRTIEEAERLARRHDGRVPRAALTAPDGRGRPLRHALEVRHPSWLEDDALTALIEGEVALVVADTAGRHPFALTRTAGFMYARLHGSRRLYASGYTAAELELWAGLVRDWQGEGDVFVYLDNDARGLAPRDASALAALVRAPDAGRPNRTLVVPRPAPTP